MLLVFSIPVPQRILRGITQLADRRLNPLAKLNIQLDRANSVCMGTNGLPPGGPRFSPHPLPAAQGQLSCLDAPFDARTFLPPERVIGCVHVLDLLLRP